MISLEAWKKLSVLKTGVATAEPSSISSSAVIAANREENSTKGDGLVKAENPTLPAALIKPVPGDRKRR